MGRWTADQLESVNDRSAPGCRRSISLARRFLDGRMRTAKAPFGQLLRSHLGQTACSASPDGSFAIARIAIAKYPATSNDRFVAATLARTSREAATCVANGALTSPIDHSATHAVLNSKPGSGRSTFARKPAAGRQGRAGENVPRTAGTGLCRLPLAVRLRRWQLLFQSPDQIVV
jgi:hypothetical protein